MLIIAYLIMNHMQRVRVDEILDTYSLTHIYKVYAEANKEVCDVTFTFRLSVPFTLRWRLRSPKRLASLEQG